MPLPADEAGRFSLRIERSMAGLQRLGGWIDRVSAALGLAGSAEYALRLCAEEAAANVVMHGTDGGAGGDTVALELAVMADALRLTVEDHCPSFDPLTVGAPDLPRSLEEARIGGMGIHLLRQYSAAMHYERDGCTNRLTMTIRR